MGEKLLDAKSKKEMEEKIDTLLAAEREFAENSPMPPPEFAATGVYCTGDDCHKIQAEVGAADCRGDAAEIERQSGVDSGGIWVRQKFGRSERADSLWRYEEVRSRFRRAVERLREKMGQSLR